MRFIKDFPKEEVFMQDPVHVEHTVRFGYRWIDYPFEEMDTFDFFRIDTAERAQATRAAVQRFYEKEPWSYFVVRKYEDEWICRRLV